MGIVRISIYPDLTADEGVARRKVDGVHGHDQVQLVCANPFVDHRKEKREQASG